MSTLREETSSDSEEEKRGSNVTLMRRGSSSSELIAAVVKERKISLNIHHKKRRQFDFGVCFDIDGVLARGSVAIPAAQAGIKKLVNEQNKFKYPVAFVTNALNTNQDKANQLSAWFGIEISKDQMIQSPSPLEVFEEYHDKFCLCVGQGKMIEIARDLGLTKLCTIEDVAAARPLLDVINHENRKKN